MKLQKREKRLIESIPARLNLKSFPLNASPSPKTLTARMLIFLSVVSLSGISSPVLRCSSNFAARASSAFPSIFPVATFGHSLTANTATTLACSRSWASVWLMRSKHSSNLSSSTSSLLSKNNTINPWARIVMYVQIKACGRPQMYRRNPDSRIHH